MIWVAKNLYFFNCLLDGAHTKFGAAALLFTFLIETTNGQILKNVPKTVFCVWVIKTNLKYIDISGGSWYDKNRCEL